MLKKVAAVTAGIGISFIALVAVLVMLIGSDDDTAETQEKEKQQDSGISESVQKAIDGKEVMFTERELTKEMQNRKHTIVDVYGHTKIFTGNKLQEKGMDEESIDFSTFNQTEIEKTGSNSYKVTGKVYTKDDETAFKATITYDGTAVDTHSISFE